MKREVWWCYGARNGQEHPFSAEVRRIISARPHFHSFIAYSKPGVADQIGKDYDASGHLTVETLERLRVPQDADFYLCGPQAFLKEITAGLNSWGVSDSRIHTEIFGAESPITPGIATGASQAPHPPAKFAGTGPKVSFTRSGLTASWDSRFGSLLEFAEACDIPVRWSCSIKAGDLLQVSAPRGKLHACCRYQSRSSAERGYRGDAGTFNASRACCGGCSCKTRRLVVLRSSEWPGTSLRG